MNKTLRLIIIIILCTKIYVADAQESITLSIDSAIVYAINHNKTLTNSKYAIEKSSKKIKETFAQGLPQASASIDYNNFLGAEAELKISDMAPPATIEFNPTCNLKASVTQIIFNGNYYLGLQLSKMAKSMSEQSYEKDELNVKEQTIQAYYLVLASEKILKTINENKANAQIIFEKTNNLAKAGIIEQTEAKKLSIMISSVDNAIKSTERQIEMAYNLLRLQLGLEPDSKISLTTSFDETELKYLSQSAVADSFSISKNIDYKLISMQSDLMKKQVTLKKTNYLPSLVAYYSYTEKLMKPLFDMTPKHVLGLTLNIPIFSSGMRCAQVSQAKIDYDIAENTKELVQQQITIQERQLKYNYKNLVDQYLTQKENVEISKEVLDKMKLKFEQGIVSSLELTSANNDYLSAETNYISITLQLLNAELALRKINNKL